MQPAGPATARKQDPIATTTRHQQHLTAVDVAMIARIHAKVCARNTFAEGSIDAERTAALLIREFQNGVSGESELLDAFMGKGVFKVSIPSDKLALFVGNDLNRWKTDTGGAPPFLSGNTEPTS